MFNYKPIDKKQVEQRLHKMNNPQKKRNIFKIKEDVQTIRIIPYIHNDSGCAFIERNMHYGLNGGTIICPTTYGEDCPICKFASELWQKGEKDMAKKFFKSSRIFVPIITRDGDNEPKFMSVNNSNYQDILNTIADPDYGDVIHPLEGRDATVVKIPEGQYGKVVIKFKPKVTPIADSEKKIEEILNSCQNFDTVYPRKSEEELEEILKKTIAGNRETPQNSDEPPASRGTDKDYLKQINKALG